VRRVKGFFLPGGLQVDQPTSCWQNWTVTQHNVPGDDGQLTIHEVRVADDHSAWLRLSGELDRETVHKLCDAVVESMSRHRCRLVLDLSCVTRCDNASLFTLLGIYSALRSAGGGLVLAAASPAVREGLGRAGLKTRMPLRDANPAGCRGAEARYPHVLSRRSRRTCLAWC
jgi:anti-anti-sigma factor